MRNESAEAPTNERAPRGYRHLTNEEYAALRAGAYVLAAWAVNHPIRRRLLEVTRNAEYGSGWRIVLAATEPCAVCGHIMHPQSPPIDGYYLEEANP